MLRAQTLLVELAFFQRFVGSLFSDTLYLHIDDGKKHTLQNK